MKLSPTEIFWILFFGFEFMGWCLAWLLRDRGYPWSACYIENKPFNSLSQEEQKFWKATEHRFLWGMNKGFVTILVIPWIVIVVIKILV